MRRQETTFEHLEDQQVLQDGGQVHNHFKIDATTHHSVLPKFMRNKIAIGAAGLVGAAVVMGFIAEEEKWLPHHETTVQPSPGLLKSVAWPESIIVDSGNSQKTMKINQSFGGSVPVIGGLLKAVDGHTTSTGVVGEVQVLLRPKSDTEPAVSMSWYKAGTKKLSDGKSETLYGVRDEVDYDQLNVQEAAVKCIESNDSCLANVQQSILSDAVDYSPLILATAPLKLLPLVANAPVVGGIATGIEKIIGNDEQMESEATENLYVDAQQDMGSECSTTLLNTSLLSYGIAKATAINLAGMANLDSTLPGLAKASSYYAEAEKEPILVKFVNQLGDQASQNDLDGKAPAAVNTAIFAKQFGSSSKNVSLVGDNTCKVDSVAAAQISKAMTSEVKQRDETIVASQTSQAAAKS